MRWSRGRTRKQHEQGVEPPTLRGRAKPSVSNQAVLKGMAAPAETLSPAVRARMEAHFGCDLSGVRVHTGPDAAVGAEALGARAFTAGRDIVLGHGVSPDAADPTMRHEIAHAIQQGMQPVANTSSLHVVHPSAPSELAAARGGPQQFGSVQPAIARDPSPIPDIVPPTTESFREVYHKFELESDRVKELALARRALDLMSTSEDAMAGGANLATYFLKQGLPQEAARALSHLQDAWMIHHVSISPSGPDIANSLDPVRLQQAAEEQARAGNDKMAFQLFGQAYQMLTFIADEAGPKREERAAAKLAAVEDDPGKLEIMRSLGGIDRTLQFYVSVGQAYDRMRDILAFYHTLAAEATADKRPADAARYTTLGASLYEEIRDKWIWSGTESKDRTQASPPSGDRMPLAEVELQQKGSREALRVFGANHKDIDVTALPGLPPPHEVTPSAKAGSITYQAQSVGAFTEALYGQVLLSSELRSRPAIQKEFGKTEIDMQNLDHRLRIWRTMYRDYESENKATALPSLMNLMGRYLKAFTIHTTYNVPDSGVSYLSDNMNTMPSDLSGRLERDCGVYALTVAYEVFRTAKPAGLKLDFHLYSMTDHVALVILNQTTKEYFVVNNDQIIGPNTGDPAKDVANQYVGIAGVRYLVTPATAVSLGTTASSDAGFKKSAWEQYQVATGFGLGVKDDKGGVKDNATADETKQAYTDFYEHQKEFDRKALILDLALDKLVADMKGKTQSEQAGIASSRRSGLRAAAFQLWDMFILLGPGIPLTTIRPDKKLQAQLATALARNLRYLYTSARPGISHPLARAAMAFEFFTAIGLDPDANETRYVTQAAGSQPFGADVKAYQTGAKPPTF